MNGPLNNEHSPKPDDSSRGPIETATGQDQRASRPLLRTKSRRRISKNIRLTPRDLALCMQLRDLTVLTSHQITRLHFPTGRIARRRLLELTNAGILQHFRPHTSLGSAPYHYTLGPRGIEITEAHLGRDAQAVRAKARRLRNVEYSQRLRHVLATNEFFCALSCAVRDSHQAVLVDWWGETRSEAEWRPFVRPDGYGIIEFDSHGLSFFLEIDRGTEEHERLAAKATAYSKTAVLDYRANVVLFVLGGTRREANASSSLRGCRLPIFSTTLQKAVTAPLGPIWASVDDPAAPRRRIADLPGYPK